MNPKDKFGVKKPSMSNVPATVLMELAVAMTEGAYKYGRHNYRAVPVYASIYYDACLRHMMAWYEGEDTDPDSGISHVTKAIASLTVLRDAMIQHCLVDDRPPRSVPWYPQLQAAVEALFDKHPEKVRPYTELNKNEQAAIEFDRDYVEHDDHAGHYDREE